MLARRVWSGLSDEEKLTRFRSSPAPEANDLFQTLETRDQAELLLLLPLAERGSWLQLLPLDDAADLIQCVPQEHRQAMLEQLDTAVRREIIALLAYADDAAGGLMNPHFARLRPQMTVHEGITYLRRQVD